MSQLADRCTIGSDPELFLTNGKNAVSAIDKFPGTKQRPEKWKDGIMVQVDNCSVEYNTPIVVDRNDWIRAHLSAYQQIADFASTKHHLNLAIVPSVIFPPEELQDARAWIMGCEPDFNAWTRQWNPKPQCNIEELRSAGGHVHIGGQFTEIEVIDLAKLADMYIGVPSLLIDPDDRRRELYGKAGAMRFKPYGVEWRTGSNFWIQTEKRIGWVFDQVNRLLRALKEGQRAPAEVQEIINTGDRVGAAHFCAKHSLEICND
jgi:hypothetical protein